MKRAPASAATRGGPARPIGATIAQALGGKQGEGKPGAKGKLLALKRFSSNPRSGEPVWRNSYYEGQIEREIWKPIAGGGVRGGRRWTAALFKAAHSFEIRTRTERRQTEPGARNGALGPVALEVLRYLYEIVDYATGRLEPAVATIARKIGHSYSAVHSALCRLRDNGFLNWMRRSRPIENPEPDGPQVQQISNAYALLVPPSVRGWLSRLFGPRSSACDQDRRKADAAEFDRMLGQMSAVELADTFHRDTILGPTLRGLAAAVDAREARHRESSTPRETGAVLYTAEE